MSLTKIIGDFSTALKVTAIGCGIAASSLLPMSSHAQSNEFKSKTPSEQLGLVYQWYLNAQDDSLEHHVLSNNILFHKSGRVFQTVPTSGIGSIIDVDGVPYVQVTIYGGADTRFVEEGKHVVRTIPAMANFFGINNSDEVKNLVEYTGFEKNRINVIYAPDNSVEAVVYEGPVRHFESIYLRDRILSDGSVIKNHINAIPNRVSKIPAENFLRSLGYDVALAHQIGQEVFGGEGMPLGNIPETDWDAFIDDLNAQMAQKDDEIKSLRDDVHDLTKKSDSLVNDRKSLLDFIKKTEGGPGIYMSTNGDVSYALHVGTPVGKNNRTLSLLGSFYLGEASLEQFPETTVSEVEYIPSLGVEGHSVSTERHSTYEFKFNANILAGYEFLPNTSFLGGVKFSRNKIDELSRVVNETWVQTNAGERIDHNRSVNESIIEGDLVNEFTPIVGINYRINPLKLSMVADPINQEYKFGVILNMNFRTRNRQ